MMVVPVFTTSCQVSENPNAGPVTIHRMMTPTAAAKAQLLPAYNVAFSEILSSHRLIRIKVSPPHCYVVFCARLDPAANTLVFRLSDAHLARVTGEILNSERGIQ